MKPTATCLRLMQRHLSTSTSTPSRSQTLAFLGIGRMGSEMAFNLFSKQHAFHPDAAFVVCDAVPAAALAFADNFREQFPRARVQIVGTPEEAVLASRTLVTMLPSSPHVQEVYTEAHGVLSALSKLTPDEIADTLCIDSTTLDVDVARQVAARVHDAGAMMVDAPVSGGVTGAKAGTLTFLVGGPDRAHTFSMPFLANMGRRIIRCGPSGAGLVAKICNNLLLGIQQIGTAEAMLLGQRLGVIPAVLAEVINSSTGACWAARVNNPVPGAMRDESPPCEREYEGGFATALMRKDMGLATDSAKRSGCALPLGIAAEGIYEDVMASRPEFARKDFSSVYKYLERQSVLQKS